MRLTPRVAGFRSEYPAGFKLECMAGFVGTRSQRARQSKAHPDCRSTTIKLTVMQISLALSSRRDNHPLAATAEMAILIVAVFPSRLSRHIRASLTLW